MRGIEKLHPKVRAVAERLQAECAAHGIPLLITDTLRTTGEQDALYAQGRTAPGKIVTNARGASYQSPHQWGVAFDFCKNVKGSEYTDRDFFYTVGALAISLGLYWGGHFKNFPDLPHLEHPEFLPGNSTTALKARYGAPDAFLASVASDVDETVRQLLTDGVAHDTAHWKGYLSGVTTTRPEYVKTVFDRYHSLLKGGKP